ncbi:MAG: shikimate dehydrogenase [Candidatus Omnitrophota bacterium]
MDRAALPKIYGVLGYPVKHSFSPAMHNAALRTLKINAEYKLFEIPPVELDSFLQSLDEKNIYGLNITVPYKEKVFGFVSIPQDYSYLKEIGAINTIVKKGSSWLGFNTDILGFEKHLRENFEPAGKRCAILGAGGACRAVAYVLAKSKAREIAIFDIDNNKAVNISNMIRNIFPEFKIMVTNNVAGLEIKEKDLLVNATPVGLKESDPSLVSPEMLRKDLFVYDLIYNPAETKLLSLAKQTGAKTSNGLGMLLYQGAASFELWMAKKAPVEIMRKALQEGMEKL